MKLTVALQNRLLWLGSVASALAASYAFGHVAGIEGMALGLAAAAFGTAALWMLVRWLGTAATAGASPRFGSLLTLLAFAAKIPLYVVLWRLCGTIGESAPACFLTGVVLVYFAVVAWAATAKAGDRSAP